MGGPCRPHALWGEQMAGLSNWQLIKAILSELECPGRLLVLADCPWCNREERRDRLELDPQAGTYFCGSCGRRGKLDRLEAIAEGVFLKRHKESVIEMTTRPGVERGGGQVCKRASKTSRGSDRPRT